MKLNRKMRAEVLICVLALLVFANSSFGQFTQQGDKLVGTGEVGGSWQGISAALAADGNTAIVGGPLDDNYAGASWIFARSGGEWIQQGSKLGGNDAEGISYQGVSVGISADGNTAIVGGNCNNNQVGATWIFTRGAGVWTQQGSMLVGSGATGAAGQGISVSISADGNTAVVGGNQDDSYAGAIWIFTRTGNVWSQQGKKLVGTGAVGTANQGNSVGISADGNTAIEGGWADDGSTGAAWIFTRTNGVWSQQGSPLVGTGAVGKALQGMSVALSSDGNTAIVGGNCDSVYTGAAWIFTRIAGAWTQQGTKLVGYDCSLGSSQGVSVSLSSDGNTAMVGGWADNGNTGAAWIFSRNGGVWSQQGKKIVGAGGSGGECQGRSVSLSADGKNALSGGYEDNFGIGAIWAFTQNTSGVPKEEEDISAGFKLNQNFPNPFNPTTMIQYFLPSRSEVVLTVYNTLGQPAATLVRGEQNAGIHEVRFDGAGFASGVYFYKLQAGTHTETRKLLLVR